MKSRAFCRNLAVTVAIISLLSFVGIAGATEKTASIEGVVAKVDLDANKLEVKTADGTEHIMRLAKRTVVHGERASSTRGDNALRDLREEDKVVVHYTKHGTDETAEEIDQIGRNGLKTSEGTITEIDRKSPDDDHQTCRWSRGVLPFNRTCGRRCWNRNRRRGEEVGSRHRLLFGRSRPKTRSFLQNQSTLTTQSESSLGFHIGSQSAPHRL